MRSKIQVSAAAKGAEAQSPGVTLSFVIKSGSNKLSGMYLGAWQDGAFQGNNVTQDLRTRGFDPGNNTFTRYNDVSLDLGGPIMRDRLWFYATGGIDAASANPIPAPRIFRLSARWKF